MVRSFRSLVRGRGRGRLAARRLGHSAVAAPKVACSKATFKSDNTKKTSTSVISQCTNPFSIGRWSEARRQLRELEQDHRQDHVEQWQGRHELHRDPEGWLGSSEQVPHHERQKDALIVSTGKFVSGTGAAGKALKGLLYKESLCVTPTLVLYLNPGSKITFG